MCDVRLGVSRTTEAFGEPPVARLTSTRKIGIVWAMIVTDGSRKLKMEMKTKNSLKLSATDLNTDRWKAY
jgi:hypothetical protein